MLVCSPVLSTSYRRIKLQNIINWYSPTEMFNSPHWEESKCRTNSAWLLVPILCDPSYKCKCGRALLKISRQCSLLCLVYQPTKSFKLILVLNSLFYYFYQTHRLLMIKLCMCLLFTCLFLVIPPLTRSRLVSRRSIIICKILNWRLSALFNIVYGIGKLTQYSYRYNLRFKMPGLDYRICEYITLVMWWINLRIMFYATD